MVRRRIGPDARHWRIAGHRPALAGSLGRNVEEDLRVEPELLGEHEGLTSRGHGRTENHVVAYLRGLSGAELAGVNHGLGHRLEEGLGALELLVRATDHQVEGSGSRVSNSAGNGRSDGI